MAWKKEKGISFQIQSIKPLSKIIFIYTIHFSVGFYCFKLKSFKKNGDNYPSLYPPHMFFTSKRPVHRLDGQKTTTCFDRYLLENDLAIAWQNIRKGLRIYIYSQSVTAHGTTFRKRSLFTYTLCVASIRLFSGNKYDFSMGILHSRGLFHNPRTVTGPQKEIHYP